MSSASNGSPIVSGAAAVAFRLPLGSGNASVDLERLEQPEQVGLMKSEKPRGLGAISFRLGQRLLDHLTARGVDRLMIRGRARRGGLGGTTERKFAEIELRAGTEDDRALDNIAELADVAGPVVGREPR